MKKRTQKKINVTFSPFRQGIKGSSDGLSHHYAIIFFLLLLAFSVCLVFVTDTIARHYRDEEADINETLQEYLSGSFSGNLDSLYTYNIDLPMETFFNSSAVTSFLFCSEQYPADEAFKEYLQKELTSLCGNCDYITAAAVYASSPNDYITSEFSDKKESAALNGLLEDMIYSYNSNNLDKNKISGNGFNTFQFQYQDYVVFSKDLTTLSGSSHATMFVLLDPEAVSSFIYRANGMIPYKVSVYDSHSTLLFSNTENRPENIYSRLLGMSSGDFQTEQVNNTCYIYCSSDVMGLQYILEMDLITFPKNPADSWLLYGLLFLTVLLFAALAAGLCYLHYRKAGAQLADTLHLLEIQETSPVRMISSLNSEVNTAVKENVVYREIISTTSAEAAAQLFARLITGQPVEKSEAEITLNSTKYGFRLDDIYTAGILHQTVTEFIRASSRHKILNMLNSIFNKFKEKNTCNLCAFLFDEKSFIIIASFPSGTSIAKGKTKINELTQLITDGITLLNLPMTIAFGHMYNSILDLSFSYSEAFKAMHYKSETTAMNPPLESLYTGRHFPPTAPSVSFNPPAQPDEPGSEVYGQSTSGQDTPGQDSSAQNISGQDVSPQDVSGLDASAQDISSQDASAQDITGQNVSPQDISSQDVSEQIDRRASQIAQLIWNNQESNLPSLIERTLNDIFTTNTLSEQTESCKRLVSAVTSHMLSYPFVNDSHLSNVYEALSALIDQEVSSASLRQGTEDALSTLCKDFSELVKKQRIPYIVAAQEYIGQHYNAPDLSLEEIADNLKIAPNYLSTIFSKNLGIKLFEYINEYRLEKSIELLLHSDKTVNEISVACGFGSSRNYIRIFKKYKDNTPGAYRKQHLPGAK